MKTNKGLAKEPKDGDYHGLVDIMGLLNAVRDRQPETDVMFEPLKQTIDMLKLCGVEMSEKVYLQLEVSVCGDIQESLPAIRVWAYSKTNNFMT